MSLLLRQTLATLPDQDSFYDMVDSLEEQSMETVSQRHLGRKGTDLDLVEQLNIYEVRDKLNKFYSKFYFVHPV